MAAVAQSVTRCNALRPLSAVAIRSSARPRPCLAHLQLTSAPGNRAMASWFSNPFGGQGSSGSSDGDGSGAGKPKPQPKPQPEADAKAPAEPTASEAPVGDASKAEATRGASQDTSAGSADGAAVAGVVPVDGVLVPVAGSKGLAREDPPLEPELLALPLHRRPLFPGQQSLVTVTHPDVVKAIIELMGKGTPPRVVGFLAKGETRTTHTEEGHLEDFGDQDPFDALHSVGTRGKVVQVAEFASQDPASPGGLHLVLHGHDLVKVERVLSKGPPLIIQAQKHITPEQEATLAIRDGKQEDTMKAHINEIMRILREIMKINDHFREHAKMMHRGFQHLDGGDASAVAHFAASLTTAEGEELMAVLICSDPLEKSKLAMNLLKKELDLSQLQQKISSQVDEKVSKTQREFFLREQMNMIKKELGEDKSDGSDELVQKFQKRLEGKTIPKEADDIIKSELEKFAGLQKQSQEYQLTQNYLDWLTCLPWGIRSKDMLNLSKAREILDREHHGLTDVKQRILEHIAVGCLRGSVQGKIICLVGPPGVGKTSIGRSIAEALNREFYRFSVGGLYDVAEIKGHRRTYVGAMPGKVVQCLKKTQTENPLVLIDEIDKLGRGHQGDPASALLELLDPSQNSGFMDHYLDVPVDASKVLFVCTANSLDTIPGPLLDRMEVIRLSGYDLQEKLSIAKDYLVPQAMREVGLWPVEPKTAEAVAETAGTTDVPEVDATDTARDNATDAAKVAEKSIPAPAISLLDSERPVIDESALTSLIRWYCREAGVRNLQKHIEKICRKLALKVVERHESKESENAQNDKEQKLTITQDQLHEYVGKQRFSSDRLYDGEIPPGTVTGLAWTSMGGEVLYVEAIAIPRTGSEDKPARRTPSLSITGQLGAVMKESSQLALSVARRQLMERAPDERKSFLEEHELHLHCPEGAVPKDGPSAGVTMTTALLSLGLGRPCRADLAMTGEVSLNGKVLPVGGIKEKVIAARRSGCKAVALPAANRKDFEELPEYLKEGLEVTFASHYSDVFDVAFAE